MNNSKYPQRSSGRGRSNRYNPYNDSNGTDDQSGQPVPINRRRSTNNPSLTCQSPSHLNDPQYHDPPYFFSQPASSIQGSPASIVSSSPVVPFHLSVLKDIPDHKSNSGYSDDYDSCAERCTRSCANGLSPLNPLSSGLDDREIDVHEHENSGGWLTAGKSIHHRAS